MKRRDFFKWMGLGVAIAAVPAPVRALAKAITPEPIRKRLLTTVVIDALGRGDAKTIQEGIDMLSPLGGTVHIGRGVYPITKSIEVRSNLCIIGDGGVIDIIADDIAAFEINGERSTIANLSIGNSKGHKGTVAFMEGSRSRRNTIVGNVSL